MNSFFNLNTLTETQKNAIFAFGEKDKIGTESNLIIAASICEGELVRAILMNLMDLMESAGLTDEEYEQETILLTSRGDDFWSVFTFDPALKRRLKEFARQYPEHCHLESEDKKYGSQSYVIDKGRLSIRLTAPYSVERRQVASERGKTDGFGSKNQEIICSEAETRAETQNSVGKYGQK